MFVSQRNAILILALFALALTLVACGGGSSSSTSSLPPSTPGTTVQVGLGDSPADWMTTFGMTVNSIMLTNSNGSGISMLTSPTQMEMMRLMGTVQPVSVMKVPQGIYTSATISISSIQMGYMDPATHQYVQKTMAGPFTGTVNFNPAMTVGSTPSSLNFDMNMGSSVSISNGNVTITPMFTGMMGALGTGQNPWQGYMQHMVGSVSSASGSQFTMNMMMGLQSATFATNGSTQFDGMSGMGMMSNGMIVSVDAITQADGSLLAQHVQSMWGSSGGMMGGGIVTGITGNPPTQLTIVASNGIGGGMMMSAISGQITVNVSSSTPYSADSDDVDLANLPFTPTFDNTSITKGQKVDVVSGGSMMGGGGMMGGGTSFGTINASQVLLEQQGLHGTVSNYTANGSQATFTLTLPMDSAFTTLTGISTITVYKQNGTQMHNLSAIANGNQVGVRGLLYYDSGTFKMVSTWIVGS
ncbi:MAG: DUF5666 domain-containing protein [Terriglobia bacterium]|jgi:hypothetical protein|nr:DUF5666 domain-containing protein [Terriglobia bacterium]